MGSMAAKTQITLAAANAIELETEALVFDTPEALRDRLGDLARLKYVAGEWGAHLKADSELGSTGVVLLELMAGAVVVDSMTVDLGGSSEAGQRKEVDLFSVGGAQRLHVRATVDTADTGRTVALTSYLVVSQPLSVSGC
ncbi:MAG: hypothetical protein CMP77_02040 [Flavobacterium sp.]|nr:hypothetical protein [Flavobacterium sp.]MBE98740.1 hypothetical protein [Flavobacterium sp.]|tara:strand:+ start:4660 stop:5079 length:420 start_codon:yes stop_codon:yes gene_type:complete